MKLKINKNKMSLLFWFIISHILILILSEAFNIVPFVSYDDSVLYNNARIDGIRTLFDYYITQRQVFYIIAALLNEILYINEWINGTRIFNIIIAYFTIIECGKLYLRFYEDEGQKKKFVLFMVITPLIQFWMSSLYKDGLATFLIVKLMNIFFDYMEKKHINIIKTVIYCIFLFLVRAGLFEILFGVMLFYYIRNKKNVGKYIIIPIIIIVAGVLIQGSADYLSLLDKKIDGYISNSNFEMNGFFAIDSVSDIWKLPITMIFFQISPLPYLGIVESIGSASWCNVISFTSVISMFLLPFFWYYVFLCKKNQMEKLALSYYFIWLVVLALNKAASARFYVFLTPIFLIIAFRSFEINQKKRVMWLMSTIVCAVWFVYLAFQF